MEFLPQRSQAVCVVGQSFCSHHPTDLSVQKKAIGEDFTVTDSNANVVLKVAGKLSSHHDTRLLRDAAGNPLLTMKQKMLSMHRRWEAFTGDGFDEQSFVFCAKKSAVFQEKTALDVFMAGGTADEKVCDVHVKGSYCDRSCTIYQGDRILAEMKRKYTAGNVLLGKDTFAVTVQPGVDYAFIVALIVILDEIDKEGSDKD